MKLEDIKINHIYQDISGRVFLCQAKDWNGVYDAMGCTYNAKDLEDVTYE